MRKSTLSSLCLLAVSVMTSGSAMAYSDPSTWRYDTGWKLKSQATANDGSGIYAGQHDPSSPVYVCRHSNLPGKAVNGKCYISYRGREYGTHNYKSLLTKFGNLVWDSRLHGPYVPGALPNNIRTNAVVGGNEGFDVFICKGKHGAHTVVGKFVRGHGCYYGQGGREFLLKVSDDNFSVLTDRASWSR
ncbi:DUF3421 domain-containing protein [Pseudoalteromonas sp. SMS1]|uniref:DM9 repeat-containing protein n=1 Tax=Pseudoalteromonas sp. SMS1 TaxID=2908894 RepID=UPI001F42B11A|nr:DM9 repeat-containing protein [Pseudoalteromonas sp. SMS1]MCF2857008.1 DUF3421 domain-containing protein [Pseudoalteromonas sp. SMS1]